MPKYLKIAPDPDAHVCHCGDGNPDCDHWESCDGCGMDYRKHEGHDCIDGVPVQDLRALAKELRDALDACETERDRLRSELDAAHDGEDASRSEVAKLRAQIAALQSVPQGVEVPPYPDVLVRQSISHTERHAGILEGVEWARKNARLPPTPPQPAPDLADEFDRILSGVKRYAFDATKGEYFEIAHGAFMKVDHVAQAIYKRDTPPQPIQPEERRVGPDEVVVGREEWEAVQEFADLIVPIRDNLSGISWIGKLSDVFAAYDRWYAVRTSAQAHNGEESKLCVNCGNWTGCPNLAARNRRKGCDSFERGGEQAPGQRGEG